MDKEIINKAIQHIDAQDISDEQKHALKVMYGLTDSAVALQNSVKRIQDRFGISEREAENALEVYNLKPVQPDTSMHVMD